jgi:hypothetical protein
MQAPLKKASANSKPLSTARSGAKSPIKRATSTIGSLYHEDMNIKYLGRLVDGKKNGEGREFHSNGNPYYDGNYQNNQPHAEKLTTFHSNKQAWYTGAMHEGQKQGNGTEFYDNGQILYSGIWEKDEPYGENVTIFNNDGSVMFEGRKIPAEETSVIVTEETLLTTVETEQGVTTTTETVTTELLAGNQESEAKIVLVTDSTDFPSKDAPDIILEVDHQVPSKVDLENIETAELISTQADGSTIEIIIGSENGLDIAENEVVEVLLETQDGQVHIDVVGTKGIDHVDIEGGQVNVNEGETVIEVVGED